VSYASRKSKNKHAFDAQALLDWAAWQKIKGLKLKRIEELVDGGKPPRADWISVEKPTDNLEPGRGQGLFYAQNS
jgi:hypothetical protein